EALLTRGLVQLIASDAHSPVNRPPALAEAVRAAARWVGSEAAQSLVGAAPFAVVQDMVPPAPPAPRPAGWLPTLMARLRGGTRLLGSWMVDCSMTVWKEVSRNSRRLDRAFGRSGSGMRETVQFFP